MRLIYNDHISSFVFMFTLAFIIFVVFSVVGQLFVAVPNFYIFHLYIILPK